MSGRDYSAEIDVVAEPAANGAYDWPLAAAMLQIPSRLADGRTMNDASAEEWQMALRPLQLEGFTAVELSCLWLDVGALAPSRVTELKDVLRSLDLEIAGYLLARRSVVDPETRDRNITFTHQALDAASALGTAILCTGLHTIRPKRAGDPQWFWNIETAPVDMETWGDSVLTFRKLAEHADNAGVHISLEMFPGTFVGSADLALRFLEAVDHPAFSLNPDLGNFVRLQQPIEDWEELAVRILPHTRYWHVKNYARLEHPGTNLVLTHPLPLDAGIIDYRKAVNYAKSAGFSGTIVVEHYGGDGLAVSATGRDYLRRLLR